MKMSEHSEHLRPCHRVGKKDRVARRDVGDRDAGRQAVFRHRDIRGERAPAEGPQIDLGHAMLAHAEVLCDARRRLQLDPMPLAVIERERVALEAVAPGDAQAGGGIQSSAQ